MKKLLVLFLFLFLFTPHWIQAAWKYVRPAGGNYGLEDGSSYENAWDGEVNVNWSVVDNSDGLYILGGVFLDEQFVPTQSGEAATPMILNFKDNKNPPGILESPTNTVAVMIANVSFITVENLTVRNTKCMGLSIDANIRDMSDIIVRNSSIDISDSDHEVTESYAVHVRNIDGHSMTDILIEKCVLVGTEQLLAKPNSDTTNFNQVTNGLVIQDCIISESNAQGIDINAGTGAIIRRNFVFGQKLGTLKLHAGAASAQNHIISSNWLHTEGGSGVILQNQASITFVNNTVVKDTGYAPLYIREDVGGFSSMTGTIKNNIFYGDWASGIVYIVGMNKAEFETAITMEYNDYWQSGVSTNLLVFEDDAGNNITEVNFATNWAANHEGELNLNPGLVAADGNDYHLLESSPCIDTGINVDRSRDFDGKLVPRDGNGDGVAEPDIGACEYQSPVNNLFLRLLIFSENRK